MLKIEAPLTGSDLPDLLTAIRVFFASGTFGMALRMEEPVEKVLVAVAKGEEVGGEGCEWGGCVVVMCGGCWK